MKKHILVTGGAGFIGSHLVDALVLRGEKVTVLDKKSAAERLYDNPKAKYIEADLTEEKTMELVKELKPDVVFHLGANASVAKSVADPGMDKAINLDATVRLMDVAAELEVETFVFASTGGALSSEKTVLPTPESSPSKPLSPYAAHKLEAEQKGEYLHKTKEFPFVALRLANVYGPRQTASVGESNVIATYASRMVRNELTSVNGSGRQTRDYVFVDDVVRAFLSVLDAPETRGVLNVGSGIEVDVLTLHRFMAGIAGYGRMVEMRPAQAGEPMRSCLDITKAKKELAWKPRVALVEGLSRTITWHREQLGDIPAPASPPALTPRQMLSRTLQR